MKILFTSVGRRVELMQAFHQAAERLHEPLTILGADITDTAPALFFCDERRKICRIRDPEYIPQLLAICEFEHIDCLIPTIDTDLLLLAENKPKFEAIGTKVLISAPDKVRVCRDKRFTAAYFQSIGLKSPLPYDSAETYIEASRNGSLNESLQISRDRRLQSSKEGCLQTNISLVGQKTIEQPAGFPAFIKPRDGSSSINAYKVENEESLRTYAAKIQDYIIQPYISGREYTIDIFCDYDGHPVYITPRERLAVRAGEVLKTQIVQDDIMIAEMLTLVQDYKPCGPITVQLIHQDDLGESAKADTSAGYNTGCEVGHDVGSDRGHRIEHSTGYDAEPGSGFGADHGMGYGSGHTIGADTGLGVGLDIEHSTGHGTNYYIEINPRFGGGAPLSMKAGADSAEAVIRMLRGETLTYQEKAARNKETYSRFDQSVCVSGYKQKG